MAPIDRPAASAYITVIHDSVIPTVAIASGPSRPTKNTSATTKMDSMSISRTIGTASNTTARESGASVKSCRDPRTASLTVDHSDG
jgi:hypothetical protein